MSRLSRAWLAVRREPFRAFFPLGALLGAVGVGHWVAYATHVQSSYSGQAHALVQVQAFLMAFAAGFLLTMLQRRAGGVLAPNLTIAGLAAGLVAVTAFSLAGEWELAQVGYLAVLALVGERAWRLSRRAGATGRPPAPFVLVPVGLAQGAAGSLMLLAQPLIDAGWPTLLGRWLVQEGSWICLALGVGHVILPTLTGTEPHPPRGGVLAHALVGVAVAATLVLQHVAVVRWGAWPGIRLGAGLRGALVAWELGACMRAWRWPRAPGTHRKLVWLSFWLVPVGLLLVAAFPAQRVGILHVVFVGGFSLMTFAVAAHVIAAHGGYDELLSRASWTARVLGALVLAAMLTRVAADLLPPRAYWSHVAFAAGIWLVALGTWVAHLLPKALRPRRTDDEDEPGRPELVQVTLPRK